jgi:hypothetical protein
MEPVSPVLPNLKLQETVYAADQKPYRPLPAYVSEDGYVLSRWRLSWKERLRVFLRGDLYHWQGTFGQPLQPISMTIEPPATT